MDDDAIAQVVMVTNTTPEKAAQYLTLADGDPDQAVTLFFENGGQDLVGGPSSSAPTTSQPTASSRAPGAGDAQNPINIDDEAPANTVSGRRRTHAFARSNAEELRQPCYFRPGDSHFSLERLPIYTSGSRQVLFPTEIH